MKLRRVVSRDRVGRGFGGVYFYSVRYFLVGSTTKSPCMVRLGDSKEAETGPSMAE